MCNGANAWRERLGIDLAVYLLICCSGGEERGWGGGVGYETRQAKSSPGEGRGGWEEPCRSAGGASAREKVERQRRAGVTWRLLTDHSICYWAGCYLSQPAIWPVSVCV